MAGRDGIGERVAMKRNRPPDGLCIFVDARLHDVGVVSLLVGVGLRFFRRNVAGRLVGSISAEDTSNDRAISARILLFPGELRSFGATKDLDRLAFVGPLSQVTIDRSVASRSASAAGLSMRIRLMRGKRIARPDL